MTAWARVHLRSALKEPLLHFLIAGFAVFLISAWRGEAADPESRIINISEPQVEQLVAGWTQTWRRPPSPAELDGLIHDYVEEEVYYREAIRLGFDRDDPVVRRRLRSKMEFLATSEAETAAADDSALQRWLDHHGGLYQAPARYSFDQIFFDATDAAGANRKAEAALEQMALGLNWHDISGQISLPAHLEAASSTDVARQFGDDFASSLSGISGYDWVGPIQSGFGLHLVRLRAKMISGKPRLADVRQRVENDWRAATKADRAAKAYQALLDRYTVKIEKP
jgi:peptidyl-prolyl cis-trans isomerase C